METQLNLTPRVSAWALDRPLKFPGDALPLARDDILRTTPLTHWFPSCSAWKSPERICFKRGCPQLPFLQILT